MNARISLIPPAALIQAARRVLRPLVRLLLSHGVGFPFFSSLAKEVYVGVAAKDFPDDGGVVTDSRVSILSGVHRREVKRLRTENVEHTPPTAVSFGAQLVARWCAEPAYMDTHRRPLPLPRLARKGGESSFEKLVAGVSKDIRSHAVLDEWLRLGVAKLDDEDRVHLLESAFIPTHGFDEKAFYFGKGIHDHMAAATHNMLGMHPPFLDRVAYYDGLTPESAAKLRELARDLALGALQEINRKALELQAADTDQPGASTRVTFGAYFYAEEDGNGPRQE